MLLKKLVTPAGWGAVLDYLAPDDKAVYAPAHLWKATQILASGKL